MINFKRLDQNIKNQKSTYLFLLIIKLFSYGSLFTSREKYMKLELSFVEDKKDKN